MMEVLGATGAIAAAGSLSAYAVRGRSSSFFAPSVYHGDRSRPVLALTFDDGPSPSTPALLEILAANNVRATFFMCGRNVRRNPGVAREVAQAGHEIGNHTDTHSRMDFKSPEFIYQDMALAQETIHIHTGAVPVFFRAPFGVRWFGLRRAQERLHLTGVMWTVLGRDWALPANRISQRVTGRASNGGILCLHDGRALEAKPDIRQTLEAVQQSIPRLISQGFEFQTVSEMIGPRVWNIEE